MKSKMNLKTIVMMAAISVIAFFFINMSLAANTAKINVETANLRETADENAKILELLSLNQEVEILEKTDNWYKVKAEGIVGYLRQDLVITSNNQDTVETNSNVAEVENTQTNSENKQEEQEKDVTEASQTTEIAENTAGNESEKKQEETAKIELGKQKVNGDTKLKILPIINSTEIAEIKKDEEVNSTEIINGWVYVETKNAKGWIRKEKLSAIEESKQEETEKQDEEKQEEAEKKEGTAQKTLFVNTTSINLRKEASTSSEIITTLPLNTAVDVLEESNGWYKVKVSGKEGYVSASLLSDKKQETSRNIETPRKTEENKKQETATPAPTPSSPATSSAGGSNVVEKAKSYIGSSYVYGGASPSGFDCSGFTSYIYKQCGINLNRTAAGQYSNGTAVDRGSLQPGDLIMFGKSGINHVGIYMGDGNIVHAANPSRGVTIDTINSGYYNNNYVGARRVIN